MLEWIDFIARPIGWLLAAGIGVSVLFVAFAIVSSAVIRPFGLGQVLAMLWSGPVAAVVVFLVWRIFRFAGGYVGSSTYPLEHVVRLFWH